MSGRLCAIADREATGFGSPAPKHDRVVLIAMPNGQLCYMDDGGVVDFRDVVRRHCERRERERKRETLIMSASAVD